jgi:hypothetical protein
MLHRSVESATELGPMTFPEPAIQREYCQISQSKVDPSQIDPELPVMNGSFRQFGAHGWQAPDGVRMRARRTARLASTGR